MTWLIDLFSGQSIAHSVLILCLVIASGVAIGNLRVWGISLGMASVLFTGIAFGHFRLGVSPELLAFCREFGLILFVYTIGIQVGPGFFASFRKQGLKVNLLGASLVGLGVLTTLVIYYFARLPVEVLVGLLCGAVTNTPGLGAAQQALRDVTSYAPDLAAPAMGSAVAYPFGILGVILTMVLLRRVLRINPEKEAEAYEKAHNAGVEKVSNFNIAVKNPRVVGMSLPQISSVINSEFVVSRLLRGETAVVPTADTRLQTEDVLHVVCSNESAERLALLIGDLTDLDVRQHSAHLNARNVLVTQSATVGKTIRELDLMRRYEVAITRVFRNGIELVAEAGMELQFGDRITVVGDEDGLKKTVAELGNSIKKLDHPNILPVFIGIVLGVIVGTLPIHIPGMPVAVKLGLAGGPLLMAIILSRIGKIGPVIWYLPLSANLILREIGITLFLGCVGLEAGERFVETIVHGPGLYWIGLASIITLVPVVTIAFVSRLVFKLNYLSICGLISGSSTNPPALAYASQLTTSDAPAVTYASVYALAMFLRILSAQALVIFLT